MPPAPCSLLPAPCSSVLTSKFAIRYSEFPSLPLSHVHNQPEIKACDHCHWRSGGLGAHIFSRILVWFSTLIDRLGISRILYFIGNSPVCCPIIGENEICRGRGKVEMDRKSQLALCDEPCLLLYHEG